jgi:hypothetical protein
MREGFSIQATMSQREAFDDASRAFLWKAKGYKIYPIH